MPAPSVVATLSERLAATAAPGRWCVAFSGGLDSTVLLHGLCELRGSLEGVVLRAVHVDHGLHARSKIWAEQCADMAGRVDVPLEVRSVDVDLTSGEGIEAAARRVRYAAFQSMLGAGEVLMTAHHSGDQAETFLLRLLRGAGVHGLGGISESRRFGRGRLLRPLLTIARAELEDYARARNLSWIDDPSNRDTVIDRNYLRHEVIALLRARWPGVEAAIGRAARLSAEASSMLDDIARQDGVAVMPDGLIELDGLRQLSRARQRNLIRHVLRERGLTPPSEAQLVAGLGQLLSARVDRQPLMNWPGGQIRRYRERLYVLAGDPERATAGLPDDYEWDGCAPLDLGPVRGRLQLISDDPTVRVPAALKVRFRRGGERLPAADRRHHQRLKKVFQAQGIVPWMRAHVPLVIYDGELLAVADLWSSGAMAEWRDGSCRLVWDRHAVVR